MKIDQKHEFKVLLILKRAFKKPQNCIHNS